MKSVDYMNVQSCKRCGRLYETFLEVQVCQACYKILEDKLDEVRKFIHVNEEAGLEEVAIALKVTSKQLLGWVRESRLKFSETSGVKVPCLKCGEGISHGKYCPYCRQDIMTDLQSVYEEPSRKKSAVINNDQSSRMHFLNRDKRK